MPQLKTKRDEWREAMVADILEKKSGLQVLLADTEGEYNPHDLEVRTWGRTSKLLALVEVKGRDIPHDDYPTAPVARAKYEKLVREANKLDVPAYFVMAYTDGLKVLPAEVVPKGKPGTVVREKERESGLKGANDREPGYYVPRSWFQGMNWLSKQITNSIPKEDA